MDAADQPDGVEAGDGGPAAEQLRRRPRCRAKGWALVSKARSGGVPHRRPATPVGRAIYSWARCCGWSRSRQVPAAPSAFAGPAGLPGSCRRAVTPCGRERQFADLADSSLWHVRLLTRTTAHWRSCELTQSAIGCRSRGPVDGSTRVSCCRNPPLAVRPGGWPLYIETCRTLAIVPLTRGHPGASERRATGRAVCWRCRPVADLQCI